MSWNLFGVHQYMWLFRFWGAGPICRICMPRPFFQKNRPIGYQVHKKIATPTKFYRIWCSMLKLQLPIYKSCIKTKSCGIVFQQFFWHNVRNGIMLPKLFWLTERKNSSSDPKNLLNLKTENLQKIWDHYIEQFIQTVKGQTNFGNRISTKQDAFFTWSWRFLRSNKSEQLEFKFEKTIGN